jgi:hypothetical protein
MPGTLSSSSRHSATHRARRCELEASALSSSASPLHPDKAAFLRRARAASSMGSGRGGGRNNGGGDGLDGRSHGGEDGLDGRWPRGQARQTRWVASVVTSMRCGQAAWAPRWRPRCGAGEQHGAPRRRPPRDAGASTATSMQQVPLPPAPTT